MKVSSFLDKQFRNHKKVLLGELVQPVKRGTAIKKGTLVVVASGDRKLRLRILEEDTPHKGFSEPLSLNAHARELGITPNYLLWYLSQPPVKEYLVSHLKGSVILRIPREVLYDLRVPVPSRSLVVEKPDEVILESPESPFSTLISALYGDYRHNYSNGRFHTAVILAGAITEIILYQLLLEQDVNTKILKRDRNLTLGKMLEYVRLLKIDQHEGFPMTHLVELQKKRNSAIHAGLLFKKKMEFSQEDLNCFDQIIKYFGI